MSPPENYSIGKDFISSLNKEAAKQKKESLVSTPIYGSLREAFGEAAYQQYIKRRNSENEYGIPKDIKEFTAQYKTRYKASLEVLPDPNDEEFIDQLLITSQVEGGQLNRAYILLNETMHISHRTEQNRTEQNSLSDKLDLSDIKCYPINHIFIENTSGKVIDLIDYIPDTPNNIQEKAILILNNPRHSQFTALVPEGQVITPPIIEAENMESFLHEAGHIHAYLMNPGRTMYSPERDAMSFAFRAIRILREKEFINEITESWLIEHARKAYSTYPTDKEKLKEHFYGWDILGEKPQS